MQREVIRDIIEPSFYNSQEGDLWYLVSINWWVSWKKYVGYEWENVMKSAYKPGPIDNKCLTTNDMKVKLIATYR